MWAAVNKGDKSSSVINFLLLITNQEATPPHFNSGLAAMITKPSNPAISTTEIITIFKDRFTICGSVVTIRSRLGVFNISIKSCGRREHPSAPLDYNSSGAI